MRNLQLTTELTMAGAERVVLELAGALTAGGHDVLVVGLRDGVEGRATLDDSLIARGIPYASIGLKPKWKLWRASRLRRIIRRFQPDILHCHLFHANLAGAWVQSACPRAPLVWTHHGAVETQHPARRAMYRAAWGRPDAHVYVSEAARATMVTEYGEGNGGHVIPNGIDLAPFVSVTRADAPVFGTVGRLEPAKGLDVLLRAFESVVRSDPSARLRIAGAGREERALRQLSRSLRLTDRVDWCGHVSDVAEFLGTLGVYVAPSRTEGFGLSLLESMACGLPCIVSDIPAFREVGESEAVFVPVDDPVALADAMSSSISPDAEHTRAAADRRRSRAAEHSVSRMTDRYLDFYASRFNLK